MIDFVKINKVIEDLESKGAEVVIEAAVIEGDVVTYTIVAKWGHATTWTIETWKIK